MDIHESARCQSVGASGLFRRIWAFAAVLGQVADRRDGTRPGITCPGSLALPRIPPARSQIQGERF